MKLDWNKKAQAVTEEKFDEKKYRAPGEKGDVKNYDKAPKQKTLPTITPGKPGDLQFNPKKATEAVPFKEKDVRDPGQKEKLEFGKETKWPNEGDVKSKDESGIAKKYMAKGEKGDIQKAKTFTTNEDTKTEKFQENKYRLSFDMAKPFQKQFSLDKNASQADWMKALTEQGFNRKARRQFSALVKTALDSGTPIEVATKEALEMIQPAAAPEKAEGATLPIADIVGYTMASLVKFAKECPTCFKQLMDAVETYQYYPALDEIAKPAKEGDNIQSAGKTVAGGRKEDIMSRLADLQKETATLENELKSLPPEPAVAPAAPVAAPVPPVA